MTYRAFWRLPVGAVFSSDGKQWRKLNHRLAAPIPAGSGDPKVFYVWAMCELATEGGSVKGSA